jgi:osmotically-inducible protein OsmY
LDVQTINHVVYLSGEVNAGLEKHIAEAVAQQVPGVIKVVNSIAVSR